MLHRKGNVVTPRWSLSDDQRINLSNSLFIQHPKSIGNFTNSQDHLICKNEYIILYTRCFLWRNWSHKKSQVMPLNQYNMHSTKNNTCTNCNAIGKQSPVFRPWKNLHLPNFWLGRLNFQKNWKESKETDRWNSVRNYTYLTIFFPFSIKRFISLQNYFH